MTPMVKAHNSELKNDDNFTINNNMGMGERGAEVNSFNM